MTDNIKCWCGCGATGGDSGKWRPVWGRVWKFLIQFIYTSDPAIPHLEFVLEQWKHVHKNT